MEGEKLAARVWKVSVSRFYEGSWDTFEYHIVGAGEADEVLSWIALQRLPEWRSKLGPDAHVIGMEASTMLDSVMPSAITDQVPFVTIPGNASLRSMGLSNRCLNALEKREITTIDQLCAKSEKWLWSLKGLGDGSVKEIIGFIRKIGRSFAPHQPGVTDDEED
ncbi:MAG: hypothetical protein IT428_18590 [Planctomycetaceae bacterium]|nr:hypothetical protein [Planctomycetaceae bacterium]